METAPACLHSHTSWRLHKNTGSSCRDRRNVASFVFTQHGLAVGSAFSGEEILIAFPSPPFSLVAQHIVKLSTASLSNAEDRLLVEKSCSFLRFLLLSQMQIHLSMRQKTLVKPRLLWHCGACCPKISQWSLAGREAGRPSIYCGKKPSKEYFEPGLPF